MEQKALSKLWEETSTQAQVGSQIYACKGVNHPFSRLRPILPSHPLGPGPVGHLRANLRPRSCLDDFLKINSLKGDFC